MERHKGPRIKHVPQRTCVACREVHAKGTLVRVVHTAGGVFPDPKGKLPGRGAYLHAKKSCWEGGIRESLPTALRTELTEPDRQRLIDYFTALPAEEQV